LEKTLMLGGIGGRRRRGRQRMRWLDGITDSMDVESQWTPGVGDGQGGLACCDSWGHKDSDMTERLITLEKKKKWNSWALNTHWISTFSKHWGLNRNQTWLPQDCLYKKLRSDSLGWNRSKISLIFHLQVFSSVRYNFSINMWKSQMKIPLKTELLSLEQSYFKITGSPIVSHFCKTGRGFQL